MGELIVPKEGVQQAFAAADKIISQSIRATMGIVSHPGIIRIGMDDLLSALDSTNSRCLFGFGQAKGDNRAHEALEQALKCPLLDKGKLLQDARNVLVHIGGGESMTLYEIQLVMRELSKHIDDSRTQILFGTGTDKKLGGSLTVTIVSSLEGQIGEGRPSLSGARSQPMGNSGRGGGADRASIEDRQRSGSLMARATGSDGREATDRGSLSVKAVEPPSAEEPELAAEETPLDDTSPEEYPVAEETDFSGTEQEQAWEEQPQVGADYPPPLDTAESQFEEPGGEAEKPEATHQVRASATPATPELRKPERMVEPPVIQKRVVQSEPLRKTPFAPPAPEERSKGQTRPVLRVETGTKSDSQSPAEGAQEWPRRAKISIRDLARRSRAQTEPEEMPPTAMESVTREDLIVAETEDAQKITLSRLVPGGSTVNRSEERPQAPAQSAPRAAREADPEIDEATAQQQQMLHLEPLAKGRFAKSEPTIVHGEDVDVPTFLRKRK
jgi:cell division protein FtsZ